MPIDMPTPAGFVRSSFGLEANTQVSISPITRNTQRMALSGERWTASYTIRRMKAGEPLAGNWLSFFLRCRGMANSFNAYDPDRIPPRGTPTGTLKVNGAGQSGSSLSVYDGPLSVPGWLLPGDYFSVNGELKMATRPVDTNGSGAAVIYFEPPLRNSPPADSVIVTDRPTCTMILSDDASGVFLGDNRRIYDEHSFSAYEVFE